MNNTTSTAEESAWDRVVCDEALGEDLQAVVAECELAPQRYRDLALAILEQRKLAALLAAAHAPSKSVASAATRKSNWLETTNILIPWAVAVCMTVIAASLAFSRGEVSRPGGMPEIAVADARPTMPSQANHGSVDSEKPRLVRVDSAGQSFRDWVSPMAEPVFPSELKTTFRGLGWEVRERAEIYVLEDESGTQYAIPGRDFEFHLMSDR